MNGNEPFPITELLEEKMVSPLGDSRFSCGDSDLDDFIHNAAYENYQKNISVTFIQWFHNELVGYYSLCNDSILRDDIHRKKRPGGIGYPAFPAVKLARLATNINYQSQGIGEEMFIRAMEKVYNITEFSGCRYITVDAYNIPKVRAFYQDLGFIVCQHDDGNNGTIQMYLDFLRAYNPE